ncbi:MAG: hypothetical protein Q9227_008071 [Pyrenula ochraceoflavens]
MEFDSSHEWTEFEKVVQSVYQSSSISVRHAECLASHHQVYRITLASTILMIDSTDIILKLPPRANTPQLSHDRSALLTESHVLSFLKHDPVLPVPSVLRCETRRSTISRPFLLTECLPGTRLADALPYLPQSTRCKIDQQLGFFHNHLSLKQAPAFGHPLAVANGTGCASWREAFVTILESLLRDAEDMMLSLPYAHIRQHISRLLPALDDVTEARLCMVELGLPDRVFVNPETGRVTGLVDWSWAVWGDPSFAKMWEQPSADFIEGYGEVFTNAGHLQTRRTMYVIAV